MSSTEKRLTQLEEEVRQLREEIQLLKGEKPEAKKFTVSEPIQPKKSPPVMKQQIEKPKLPDEQEVVVPKKTKQTPEELLSRWLPRVFMVVLVLGVLWGLKVMSDLGFFTNAMKILCAYMLSFAMIALAYWKKARWQANAINALLGGAFIVGILTTAAGALIYELFGQMTALLIALSYIVFGVAMAYIRGSEVLSSFVFFTSLLLPYLLAFMYMTQSIIFMYIILLFAIMQIVILKYEQWGALLIGFMASLLAIVYFFAMDVTVVWPLLIIMLIFLAVTTELWSRHIPKRRIQLNFVLLSSISFAFLAATQHVMAMIIIFGATVLCFGWLYRQQAAVRAMDLYFLLTMGTFLMMVLVWNDNERLLVYVVPLTLSVSFIGAYLKKWYISAVLQGAFAMLTGLVVHQAFQVELTWLYHFAALFVVGYSVAMYAITTYRPVTWGHQAASIQIQHIFSIWLLFSWLLYSANISKFLLPTSPPYITLLLMTASLCAVFIIPKRWVGTVLPFAVPIAWLLVTTMFIAPISMSNEVLYMLSQLFIIGVLIVVAYFILERKLWPTIKADILTIIVIAYSYMMSFAFLEQLYRTIAMTWSIKLMLQTLLLFTVAAIFMALGRQYRLELLKKVSIVLLVIAFMKLILFDLVAISIFVRAILFIIVGAVGFLLSNRLRHKGNDE